MLFLDTIIKLGLGLVALLTVTRLLGKKEMGQFTPFDFVYALILGSVLEESLYDDKISVWQMLFGVFVWGCFIYLVEVLAVKNSKINKLLKGSPSVLIKEGELDVEEMKKNHLEMEQLRTLLRQQGIFSLRDVRDLYMEPGGSISVHKYPHAEPPTAEMLGMDVKDEAPTVLLIDEGEIKTEILQFAGKTTGWLEQEVQKAGHNRIDDIYFAEWSPTSGLYIKTSSGSDPRSAKAVKR